MGRMTGEAPIPLSARLWLLAAVMVWLLVRLPVYERFASAALKDAPSVMPPELTMYLATGDRLLREGRWGGYDNSRETVLQLAGFPDLDYRHVPPSTVHRWKYVKDVDLGYGVIVAAAWLSPLPRNVYSVLILQYIADLLCLLLVCWIGVRIGSVWAGVGAAWVYALHGALVALVNLPAYGLWCSVTPVVALALWVQLVTVARPLWRDALLALLVGGVLGFGADVRATAMWLPFVFVAAAFAQVPRRRAVVCAACLLVGTLLSLLLELPMIGIAPLLKFYSTSGENLMVNFLHSFSPTLWGPFALNHGFIWARLVVLAGAAWLLWTRRPPGLILALWVYPALVACIKPPDQMTVAGMFGVECLLGGAAVGALVDHWRKGAGRTRTMKQEGLTRA